MKDPVFCQIAMCNDFPASEFWGIIDFGSSSNDHSAVTPYLALPVRNFSPRRWISRRKTIESPPRAPDLTLFDFFLWGYLKSKVYIDRPQNLQELKKRFRLEIRNITPEMIHNVQEECCFQFNYCQEVCGWQSKHII